MDDTEPSSYMDTISAAASYVPIVNRYVTPREDTKDMHFRTLGSGQILKVANVLNGLSLSSDANISLPEVPRLVVVGTQSSGKTMTLNGIIGADILPTGSQMVTRCPLHLELLNNPEGMRAEFGNYENGTWKIQEQIQLTAPNPKAEELQQIKRSIEIITEQTAGSKKGVCPDPIFLKIFSPHVPDLTLVDLPGITMTALTDQGQPRDIKGQILNMIAKFIREDRSIILAVLPARPDLEADPAMEVVRQYDPQGERTIGVLTKVDLMNGGTDVVNYLTGHVSKDLSFKYGYYAVRNRSAAEIQAGTTVHEGYALEKEFFQTHTVYKGLAKNGRLGLTQLAQQCSNILVAHLRKHLPALASELHTIRQQLEDKQRRLGTTPTDAASRAQMVHMLIAQFSREFVRSLDDKTGRNIGRQLRQAFDELGDDLDLVQPFDAKICDNDYIIEAVRDTEGNHMSFPIPPVHVLEKILQDAERRPIFLLQPACEKCAQTVLDVLQELVQTLIDVAELERFPRLATTMKQVVVHNVLGANHQATVLKIQELIKMEATYIFSRDATFMEELRKSAKDLLNKNSDANLIRSLLNGYYSNIRRNVWHNVPCAIMLFLVKSAQDTMSDVLFEAINSQSNQTLLEEPPQVADERKLLTLQLAKVTAAANAVSHI